MQRLVRATFVTLLSLVNIWEQLRVNFSNDVIRQIICRKYPVLHLADSQGNLYRPGSSCDKSPKPGSSTVAPSNDGRGDPPITGRGSLNTNVKIYIVEETQM